MKIDATNSTSAMQSREHMTHFMRRRSVVALCCGLLTLALAFYGVTSGVDKTVSVLGENAFFSFIYYTMLSNTLAALSVAFVIPYAVEGILKMRFTLPRWIAVMYHLSATSIAIMMVFVLVFMSWASPEDAFGGSNLVTHVFCPLLILIAFFQTENGQIYTLLDKLLGIVPFCVYLVVYLVEVVVVGEANNGWPDIYHITEYLSPALAIPIMLLFAFGISTVVASISNYLTRRRMAKTFRYWSEDVEPYEVRIEAYGLGRVAGLYGERNNIQVPLDILEHLAERYQLKTEDLMKPFFKGIQVGVKERESQSLAAALDLQKPGQKS